MQMHRLQSEVIGDLIGRVQDEFPVSLHSEVTTLQEGYIRMASINIPRNLEQYISFNVIDSGAHTGPEIEWNLETTADVHCSVSSGSTIKGARYKYGHDTVSGAITGRDMSTTDVPLKVIQELKDDWDAATPDFIEQLDKSTWLVIEVTTVRCLNPDPVERAYQHKLFKYHLPLEARSMRKRIFYVVIAVGLSHVVSTVKLPQKLVDDLVTRMRVACAIEDKYLELYGVPFPIDERSAQDAFEFDRIKAMTTRFAWDDKEMEAPFLSHGYCRTIGNRVDDDYVVRKFGHEVVKTIQDALQPEKETPDMVFSKFINECNSGNRRRDPKCVVNLPFILPAYDPERTTNFPYRGISYNQEKDDVVVKLWDIAFQQHQINEELFIECPEDLLTEALCDDPDTLEMMTVYRKRHRKLYHRVNFSDDIQHDDRVELALDGLWAKGLKNHHSVIDNRVKSQKGFAWDTNTDDIDAWLGNKSILDEHPLVHTPAFDLIKMANGFVKNTDEGVRVAKEILSTKLGAFLMFVEDVMVEVTISNKQNCTRRGMILKKLRNYDCYVLISPTISSQHCFISFFFPEYKTEPLGKGPFLKYYEKDFGYFTQFVSFKPGKIHNKATMASSLITLVSYWAWFYNIEPSIKSFREERNHEARTMLLLSTLIRLEDKESTEFSITQMRYMYMEVFKGVKGLKMPRPLKMLKKLNTKPRSRLTVWINRKIATSFKVMTSEPPEQVPITPLTMKEEDDLPPTDNWKGLLNPFTNSEIPSASKAISLAYTGYLKDKNEDAEGNTDFSMLDKIIDEENTLKDVPKECMYGVNASDSPPPPKGFDMRMLYHGCQVMRARMRNTLGPEWLQILHKEIVEALSTKMTEDLATLKASCSIKHEDIGDLDAEYNNKLSARRIRVLTALYREVDLVGLNPYLNFDRLLQLVEEHGGSILADLFKKKQHGGLREIFVLSLRSRIVQLYLETISRVLCSYFEEETMTHPGNKIDRLDNHRVVVHDITVKRKSTSINFCNSMDKTRWSQSMMMSMLIVPLKALLPEAMIPGIQRCLNLWVNKKIKIPQTVLNLLLKLAPIENPNYNILLDHFNNPGPDKMIKRDLEPFVTIQSGMMQGILHYTSSLLHVVFLNSMQSMIPAMIKSMNQDIDVKFTQVCSSDDSSCVLSIIDHQGSSKPSDDFKRACFIALAILETMGKFSAYYGLKDSIKSVAGLNGIVEFNSEFIINDTIAIPLIKYISAVLLISESSSLLKRQQMLYNSLGEVFKSGFPAFNTHLCQIAQGLMHYKTMGSSVNGLFHEYVDRIKAVPDPIYGFFLMDSMFFPGLMGLSFSHWALAKSTNILRYTAKDLMRNEIEVTPEGGILRTLTIKMGQSRRWKAIVAEMQEEVNLEDAVLESPDLLFRPAKTLDELKIKLVLKASLPSVAESMMRGTPFIQALASSVYSINTHCYSKLSLVDSAVKYEKVSEKVSLLLELEHRQNEMCKTAPVTMEQLKVCFPCLDRYVEAMEVIDDLLTHREVNYHVLRQKRSHFSIQPNRLNVGIGIKPICQHLWFGINLNHTRSNIQRAINYYYARLPWLRPNLEDSFRLSPFERPQELSGFLDGYMIKSRKFSRFGPGIYTRSFKLKLLLLGRKGFKNQKLLMKTSRIPMAIKDTDLIHKVNMAITIPEDEERKTRVAAILREHPPLATTLDQMSSLSYRDRKIAICQLLLLKKMPDEELVELALHSNAGMLVTYTVPQKKVKNKLGKWEWRGKGTALVQTMGFVLQISMLNDLCTLITVNDWKKLNKHPKTLGVVLKSLSLKVIEKQGGVPKLTIAKFSGNGFQSVASMGTPIIENKAMLNVFISKESLDLQINFLNMKIIRRVKERNRRSEVDGVLLTWMHADNEVVVQTTTEVYADPWDAWMNQGVWNPDKCMKRLVKLTHIRLDNQGEKDDYDHMDDIYDPRDFNWRDSKQDKEDKRVKEWFLDILHSRLVSVMGINTGLRTKSWNAVAELECITDDTPPIPEEQIDDFINQMHATFKTEKVISVLNYVCDSAVTINIDEELFALDITAKASRAVIQRFDVAKIGNFRRRMVFYDGLINLLEKESSHFWISVFNGVPMNTNPEWTNLIMELYNIKPLKRQESAADRLKKAIRDVELEKLELEREKEKKNSGSSTSTTTMVKSLPLDEEPAPNWPPPEVVEDDLEEDDEFAGFTEDMCLDAIAEFIDNQDEPESRESELPSTVMEEIIRMDKERADPAMDLCLTRFEQMIYNLARQNDLYLLYSASPTCSEPKEFLTFREANHDGSCGFHSVMIATNRQGSIDNFKYELIQSPFSQCLTDDQSMATLLVSQYDNSDADRQMTTDTLKLCCRFLGVNACVHHVERRGFTEAAQYYHTITNVSNPWIHLSYRMAGATGYWDALIKSQPVILRGPTSITEELVTRPIHPEVISANKRQLEQLARRIKELEKENARRSLIMLGLSQQAARKANYDRYEVEVKRREAEWRESARMKEEARSSYQTVIGALVQSQVTGAVLSKVEERAMEWIRGDDHAKSELIELDSFLASSSSSLLDQASSNVYLSCDDLDMADLGSSSSLVPLIRDTSNDTAD